jgi:uncharacterized Zn-finger protein
VTHRSDAQNDQLDAANTQKRVEVSRAELPVSCPQQDEKIWNAHPRVYLPLEKSGQASCPYCGTHFVLTD